MTFKAIFRSVAVAALLSTGLAACTSGLAAPQCANQEFEPGLLARQIMEGVGAIPPRECEEEVLPPRPPLVMPPTYDLPPPQAAAE